MSKNIVVYYSWAGHTRKMAEMIANMTNSDILKIKPVTPYSQNYNAVVNQAKAEIREGFLPPIEVEQIDISEYDIVFIGSPNWWSTMAPPVAMFLNQNKLTGKIIMPFASHGGGGKGHIDKDIANLCPNSKTMEIYAAYEGGNADKNEIQQWLSKNGIK